MVEHSEFETLCRVHIPFKTWKKNIGKSKWEKSTKDRNNLECNKIKLLYCKEEKGKEEKRKKEISDRNKHTDSYTQIS